MRAQSADRNKYRDSFNREKILPSLFLSFSTRCIPDICKETFTQRRNNMRISCICKFLKREIVFINRIFFFNEIKWLLKLLPVPTFDTEIIKIIKIISVSVCFPSHLGYILFSTRTMRLARKTFHSVDNSVPEVQTSVTWSTHTMAMHCTHRAISR